MWHQHVFTPAPQLLPFLLEASRCHWTLIFWHNSCICNPESENKLALEYQFLCVFNIKLSFLLFCIIQEPDIEHLKDCSKLGLFSGSGQHGFVKAVFCNFYQIFFFLFFVILICLFRSASSCLVRREFCSYKIKNKLEFKLYCSIILTSPFTLRCLECKRDPHF